MKGTRRDFLKTGAMASPALVSAAGESGPQLPQVRLGRYSISRLICGSNTFNAGSHLSVFVNHELRRYFTPDQVMKTLRRCQELGINCWQSGMANLELYRRFTGEGGKMHYVAIDPGKPENIESLARGGCIALAHHGEHTDRLFKAGSIDPIRDFLSRVRDAGMLAGISTHMPAVIDTIESRGWEVDYYMTCVYERHRTAEELQKLLGHVPIPVGEVYLQSDPPRMYRMVRQTKRPCLAFKIMAAGRLSEKPELVEGAFRDAFAGIKPSDAVIVGMYDRYSDQPAQNAEFARRFGSSA